MSTGTIAGIAVGGFVGLGIIGAIIKKCLSTTKGY